MFWRKKYFRYFEPQGWIDYILIPWWLLQLAFAWVYTQLLTFWITKTRPQALYRGRFMGWGRHDDPSPTICERCLWMGMRRWAIHTYCDDGMGDVEPVDECPRCRNDI